MSLFVDIRKDFGTFRLDVRFETADAITALLGSSGSGKSVTLRCIAGIITPDDGRIILDGVTLFDSAAGINLPPQKRRIGYLFQQYALFPHMTVRQNIAAAIRDRTLRDEETAEKLRQFQLEDVADKRPHQISGGQQQRAALARILASRPRVILLDEPLSALDSYLRFQMEQELRDLLSSFSGPVIWVSHDRGEVFRSCKQVCIVENGHGQGTRSLRSLFHEPETEAAARLSGCENFIDAVPGEQEVFLPQWGLTLQCSKPLSPALHRIGIRARHVCPANSETPCNIFSCTVLNVIQDIFTTIVLLRPEDAASNAPPLCMELSRECWRTLPQGAQMLVSIAPRDILPLE